MRPKIKQKGFSPNNRNETKIMRTQRLKNGSKSQEKFAINFLRMAFGTNFPTVRKELTKFLETSEMLPKKNNYRIGF